MQIGNDTVEFVWPGLSAAFPGLMLFIVLPAIMLFALVRWTHLSPAIKFLLAPFALIVPFGLCALIPAVIMLCPWLRVCSNGLSRNLYYAEAANMFGAHSIEVYGAIVSIAVVYIAYYMRIKFLQTAAKS